LLSQVQPVLTSQNLLCQENLSHTWNRPKKWLGTDLKRLFCTSVSTSWSCNILLQYLKNLILLLQSVILAYYCSSGLLTVCIRFELEANIFCNGNGSQVFFFFLFPFQYSCSIIFFRFCSDSMCFKIYRVAKFKLQLEKLFCLDLKIRCEGTVYSFQSGTIVKSSTIPSDSIKFKKVPCSC
jgi:hypothetical protein